jgi:Putative Ig domain/Matrixin/Ig-like domain from next to BRCA1 gene
MERVLNRVSLKAIILSICLLWSAQSALATTVIRPLDDDMIVGARAIITGKVLQIESAIDERQDRIYTYITVRVSDVIKGQITDRKIILKEPGGVVGNRISVIYGSPEFKLGEKVLLYLGTHEDGSLRTYQLFLGKFSIVKDEASGNKFVVRDTGGENVTVLTGLPGQTQGESTDRMEISSYIDMVQNRLAANLDRSQAFEEKYFKNVPVLATPPGYVSSKKQVRPDYTFLGNVRWFEPDSGQVVPYTVNPTTSTVPGAPQVVVDPNDVAAAANAWSVVPGCSLRLSYSGSLNSCYTQTGTFGVNFVSNNCDGYNQPTSGCANILAIGGWGGGGSQTTVIGGITFGQITQGFVSFNPWASCYFSDHCNLREIATHETGHALGMGHSADPTATMYAIAHFDGRCAGLKQDDMNGIAFLYPGSGGGPGPLAVVTSALSGGTAGTSYSQALTASGGTLPYGWSVVAGLGSLPTGLSLSAGGTISGTPSAAGTYNFTVKVTDAASATAQKALSIVVSAPGALAFDSQFVSQSVPTTLQPGQTFNANLKFLNTGTQTWSGSLFYLASQNPALNMIWGGNGVSLSTLAISSGQLLDVTFAAPAPTTPGTYNFQWQLYKNDGTAFFGQVSTNVAISVGVAQPNYQGFHDGAGCNTISGWAWDPANPNTTVNVDIYDGNTLIGTTPANMYREDLLNALGNPNHGFSFLTPAALKNGAVHTINVKFSGTSTLLSNTARTIQCSLAPSFFGRHDGQGSNAIEGWAWDANNPNGTVNVDIYDGSTLIGTVSATLYRQDLADALSSPYHGFIFHTPASLKDGQPHTVTVKFGGTNTNLPLDTPQTSGFTTNTPNYQGSHDAADCNMISGYAWDANDDQGTINVALYVDGGFFAVVPAQEAYLGIGTGYHGFKFAVPPSLKDGKAHSIQVKFSGTSTSLSNTPKTITCP